MGAKNRSRGSPPALAYAATSALAPSFKPGAFPGVTVPPCSNDGLSAASAASEVSLRGPSSFSTTVGPCFPGSSTGIVSALKRQASIAATAFWWLANANASWSRSEEHTSELQSRLHLVCRLLLEKKKKNKRTTTPPNAKTQKKKTN